MRALITGIGGQDGFYLTRYLLGLGYEVHGLLMYTEGLKRDLLAQEFAEQVRSKQLQFLFGNVQDFGSVLRTLRLVRPSEVYNLGAETFIPDSWRSPWLFFEVNTRGPLNFLEAVIIDGLETKFYQASSSEMFGNSPSPQNEQTPFHPRSPYGVAKLAAHELVVQYRNAYGVFACGGILFNHESPRRGMQFVTRKVTSAVAAIEKGLETQVRLGNLDAVRDWGHSEDAVRAMHLMLQQGVADDYVVGTGVGRTVREMCDMVFGLAGFDYRAYVVLDDRYVRPNDDLTLIADATKARVALGWEPRITFEMMMLEMLQADRNRTV